MLGSDAPAYYQSARALTRENAKAVLDCLAADAARAVARLVQISVSGRAPQQDPAVFGLALAPHQEKWGTRARANAAQINAFEALPFFFAAVLFALYTQAPPAHVATLMACWIGVRLGYLAMYVAGWGALRSLVWAISVGFVIAILFSGV